MNTYRVRLGLGLMEAYGAHTLLGSIMTQNPGVVLAKGDKIVVEVEVTSLSWKKLNGGPHLSCAPEYVISEIIRDVVNLITHFGLSIEVVEVEVNPK